ncbi:MAG: hypothetical protein HQM12_17315 [SAR324 cluster bacterium]|nr:hypothetical protein [SAR324 cluster bacterium]
MKLLIGAGFGVLFLVVAGIFYLLDTPVENSMELNSVKTTIRKTQETVSPNKEYTPLLEEEDTQREPDRATPQKNDFVVQAIKELNSDQPDSEAKDTLKKISENYSQMARFPSYSQPISSDQLDLMEPNRFQSASRQIGSHYRVQVKLSSYKLIQGDSVAPVIDIYSKGYPIPAVTVSVKIMTNQQQELKEIPVELAEEVPDERKIYHGRFTPTEAEYLNWPNELILSVLVNIDGEKPYPLIEMFEYVNPVATLSPGIKKIQVEGSHLVIPVQVHPKEAGFYHLSGVLYAEDGQPLLHLTGKHEVNTAGGDVEFKAHISALKASGTEGPYYLQVTGLQKLRNTMEEDNKEGSPRMEKILIPKIEFYQYTEEPFEGDPIMLKKAQMLQTLSQ